ncbi:TetR/AcrR family transcriptional regulator [Streptomyces sp. NPDC055400]
MSTPDAPQGPRRRGRGTGSYAAADTRRHVIVEAATARFAAEGYLNTSLAQIAADAGTSAPLVAHHFGSKANLLTAVLEQREVRTEQRLDELAAAGRLNCLNDILAASQEQMAYNLANPGLLELFIKLSAEAGNPSHPAHDYFVQRYERGVELLSRALNQVVASGEIRADTDVGGVARELLAVSDGLQVQWALAKNAVDLPAALDAYFARLSRALAPD